MAVEQKAKDKGEANMLDKSGLLTGGEQPGVHVQLSLIKIRNWFIDFIEVI